MSQAARNPQHPALAALLRILGTPQAAAALSLTIFGVAFATPAIRAVISWNGLIGVTVALCAVAVVVLIARRDTIEWHGLLPITIIVFVGWCALSTFWTGHQWVSAAGSIYQIAFAFLGVTVALTRDMIQIVRSVGATLRTLLTVSIVLEVFSGLIIDMPIRFLGIEGNIAIGGPIQGIFGSRNLLGFLSIIAIVTFVIEWRTRSAPRAVLVYSIAVGTLSLIFSQSPVTVVVAFVLAMATIALYGLRQAQPDTRRVLQWALLGLTAVMVLVTYLARSRVIAVLNAGSEFEYRYTLWAQILKLIPVHSLEGWGWSGFWENVPPYSYINGSLQREHVSALNAFLDVTLQLGIVGLFSFLVLAGLAFGRSWLLASNRRTVTYTWPALVLVALLTTALAESFVLVEGGWLLLVVCAVKASQQMSWRGRLRDKRAPLPKVPVE